MTYPFLSNNMKSTANRIYLFKILRFLRGLQSLKTQKNDVGLEILS